MGKRRKSRGKRRGGKKSKKGRVSRKLSKPGVAETLGVMKSVYDVESTDSYGMSLAGRQLYAVRTLGKNGQGKLAMDETVAAAKAHAGPALVGLLVSNVEVIPLVGKMARPFKRRVDRILKKWVGMKL
jgi:hypothetical protein